MNTHADKTTANQNQLVANAQAPKQGNAELNEQFIDDRPEAVAQRKIQELANNSQQVKQLKDVQQMANDSPQVKSAAQLQDMADHRVGGSKKPVQKKERSITAKPQPGHAASSAIVQRVIKLEGKEADTGQLLAEAADMAEKIVIANWEWSETVHDFQPSGKDSAKKKLLDAIKLAKAQTKEVPPLFSAANLIFLTLAEDRLPTLYFRQGTSSGRLRQQHGSGPGAFTETDKVDYFFTDQKKLRTFGAAAKAAMTNKTDFEPELAAYGASIVPAAGNFHYEVTYNGKKVKKIHPSGGTIVMALQEYTDIKIKAIYQGIIGVTT